MASGCAGIVVSEGAVSSTMAVALVVTVDKGVKVAGVREADSKDSLLLTSGAGVQTDDQVTIPDVLWCFVFAGPLKTMELPDDDPSPL